MFKKFLIALSLTAILFSLGAPESARADDGFWVDFRPVKLSFKVGEKIRFKVRSNQTFYLYLFAFDDRSRQAYVLLPNKLQQYHKYRANREYIVPERKLEFFSEKPGYERVVMLASTKKLRLRGNYKDAGSFLMGSIGAVEHEIKSLKIRSRKAKAAQVVKDLTVRIRGRSSHIKPGRIETPRPRAKTAAFVAADRAAYLHGSPMRITYGGNRSGRVRLYAVDPLGRVELLEERRLRARAYRTLDASATGPRGVHRLVAVHESVYNDHRNWSMAALSQTGSESWSNNRAVAVYQLEILN